MEETFTVQLRKLVDARDLEGLRRLAIQFLHTEPERGLIAARRLRALLTAPAVAPPHVLAHAYAAECAGLRLTGDFDAAREVLEEGERVLRETGNEEYLCVTRGEMARLLLERGEVEEAERILRDIVDLPESIVDRDLLAANLLNDLAGTRYRRGDTSGALRHARAARIPARNSGDARVLGSVEANLGLLAELAGDAEGSLEAYLRLSRICREGGHWRTLIKTLNSLAAHAVFIERHEEGLPLAEEALRLARDHTDRNGEALTLATRAEVFLQLGQLDRAREDIEAALEIRTEQEDPEHRCGARSTLAIVLLRSGDADAALESGRRAVSEAEASGNPYASSRAYEILGEILVARGEFQAAVDLLEIALAGAEGTGDLRALSAAHEGLWHACEGLPDPERANHHGELHLKFERELLGAASAARLDRLRVEHELEEERQKSETALRESERKFREIFRSSPETMVITRLEDEVLLDVNDGFSLATGLGREEAIGRTSAELGILVDPGEVDAIRAALHRGETLHRECRFVRGDGETGTAELTSKPVEIDGVSCGLTTARDVTERKRAEAALQAAYAEVRQLKDRLQAENIYLREQIREDQDFGEIIGESEPIQKMLATIRRVAATDATVLVSGETGTGKELVARALHRLSPRQHRTLVKVNCSAVSAGLVESELFGHVKGAFTGAHKDREGRFELADGGTLFLDEVGELSPETQVKLLRVLEEQEFERVGSSVPVTVDVRLIAATNRDLLAAVTEGNFRADLFYRLNVFPIRVPALRERRSDIPLLARHFLARASRQLGREFEGLHPDAEDWMSRYLWPGNVRELRNLVERATILSAGPTVELAGFTGEAAPGIVPQAPGRDLAQVESEHIRATLEEAGWVVEGPGGAAVLLGLAPSTLRSRMKKLRISRR